MQKFKNICTFLYTSCGNVSILACLRCTWILYFSISSLHTSLKRICRSFFAYSSYSEYTWSMLYFKVVFIIASVMFLHLELLSAYSGILRLVTILEKKECKDWATSLLCEMILSFYVNVICSLDTILSERKGFTIFYCFVVAYLLFFKIPIAFLVCFSEKWNKIILL